MKYRYEDDGSVTVWPEDMSGATDCILSEVTMRYRGVTKHGKVWTPKVMGMMRDNPELAAVVWGLI
jgi:hypothetical protein